ncbi:hypothetical protein MD484_g6119, partial [Candolleomyces efflorescens]
MTSSLRNSLHRRNHKERSQLAHRAKLGFLEKHKDYVLRARDYHSKQDRLTRLRQKAAEKNKDEFYFSMNNEKTRGGVHTQGRGNVALPTDYVKLLKTQDENYVRTMRMSNLKKIDKIKRKLTELANLFKSSLDGTSAEDEGLDSEEYQILEDSGVLSPKRKRKSAVGHVVFASSLEEAQVLRNSQNTHDDDSMDVEAFKTLESSEDLGWKQAPSQKKRTKPSHEEWEDEDDLTTTAASGTETRRRLLKELSARLHRDQQLQYAQREFEMQRLMMGKGARQKISATQKEEGDDESEEDEDEVDARKGKRKDRPRIVDEATYKPRVYKWKLERKR